MDRKRVERLFESVLVDLAGLDSWLKDGKKMGSWSVTEKLAFLRNVEAIQRTEEAKRRTWLSVVGFLLAATAFILAILK